MEDRDVIVAISTPPGRGAIGIVRLSGVVLDPVVNRLFRAQGKQEALKDRRAHLGDLLSRDGEVIDQGLLFWMVAPHSYTGEDVVELHCHGNPTILNALVEAAIEAGARAAGPGEFTRRAFLNGKMDLVQAEAVVRLIEAESVRGVRAARKVLAGELSRRLKAIREELLFALAHLEADVNFPEEGIATDDVDDILERLERIADQVRRLAESHGVARRLGEGLQVVICGAPNVGKSSLLNALVGRRRAIVSPLPGTTRDVVETRLDLDGSVVKLFDTAGVRAGARGLEAEGIELAWEVIETADVALFVVDGSAPLASDDIEFRRRLESSGVDFLVVANKMDLGSRCEWVGDRDVVEVSALQGTGVDALQRRLGTLGVEWDDRDRVLVVAQWQSDLLVGVVGEVEQAIDAIRSGLGVEAASDNLFESAEVLDGMLGGHARDDLVERIFDTFCVGK